MHGQTEQLKEKRNPVGSNSAHYAKHEYCGKNKSTSILNSEFGGRVLKYF
jgi:hypothetical protein